jgi:hypothetical protein
VWNLLRLLPWLVLLLLFVESACYRARPWAFLCAIVGMEIARTYIVRYFEQSAYWVLWPGFSEGTGAFLLGLGALWAMSDRLVNYRPKATLGLSAGIMAVMGLLGLYFYLSSGLYVGIHGNIVVMGAQILAFLAALTLAARHTRGRFTSLRFLVRFAVYGVLASILVMTAYGTVDNVIPWIARGYFRMEILLGIFGRILRNGLLAGVLLLAEALPLLWLVLTIPTYRARMLRFLRVTVDSDALSGIPSDGSLTKAVSADL